LILSAVLFVLLYVTSLRPAALAEKRGEKAWKECEIFRTIATGLMILMLANIILWNRFPVIELAWVIHPHPFVGIILGATLFFTTLPIWVKGLIDAGKGSLKSSEKSTLFGGIYKYIRHPQTLGEISWFLAAPLFSNSLFLFGVMLLYTILYVPIMVYFEERDLIKRFGDAYRIYQKNTGALIPKFRKRNERA
jgi:protein-S-isoprenylcysteine O-methyltransferase Ste14